MLLKLLKSNHPFVFLLIPILAAILWLPALIFGSSESVFNEINLGSPLFSIIANGLGNNLYLQKGIAFVLFVSQAFLLIRLNFKFIFIEVKTYLPAVLFVLIGSAFPFFQNLHPFLIANLFLLLAIERCFEIKKERNQFKQYFEAGLLLGVGALFYLPIVLFLLIIWVSQFVLRNFSLREWFSSILGFFTPSIIYLAILYLNNKQHSYFAYLQDLVQEMPLDIEIHGLAIYPLIFAGFVIVIALLFNISVIGARKITTRKYFILTLWMLIISFFGKLFLPNYSTVMIYAFAMPASLILTMFFVEMRSRWFSEITFTLLFFSIIAAILMQLNLM